MPLLALGVLVFAALVLAGRRPLMMRMHARPLALALAALVLGAAVWDFLRGGWLGGSLLLTAALSLGVSSRAAKAAPDVRMNRKEAASMLGLSESAGRGEVEAAFRRLMLRVHPDQGGAPGLAAQLNAARAVMLGERR